MLRELQASFREELLDGRHCRVARHIAVDEIAAGRRLEVHRNNVLGSLVAVLAAAYPATCHTAGEALFRRLAAGFIRAHPPRRPQLLAYGGAFPAYLALAAGLPELLAYLPDLARLEWARNEAYFAADATPLRPEALRTIAPDRYGELCFQLHPSTRLLRLRFAVSARWQSAQESEPARLPSCPEAGEHIVVVRPELVVHHHVIDAPSFDFLGALARGARLQAAASSVLAAWPDFDLQHCLAKALSELLFVGAEATS